MAFEQRTKGAASTGGDAKGCRRRDAESWSSMTVEDLTDPAVWRRFAPELHVCEKSTFLGASPIELPSISSVPTPELIKREGYIHASGVPWAVDIGLLAKTVRALSAAKLAPVFGFVFDEFWLPFFQMAPLYRSLLGDYKMLPDFWVWNIDPRTAEAGWRPHRDKGAAGLLPDRMPKSLTTWIPLSNATPLNSCMYVVPAMLDPTYATPEEDQMRFELQSIRALPASAGDLLMWNQAIMHWGSRSSARAPETRVSMAFEFQRADVPPFNHPLLDPMQMQPFELRLRLIAKQVMQYKHMYGVAPAVERLVRQIAP